MFGAYPVVDGLFAFIVLDHSFEEVVVVVDVGFVWGVSFDEFDDANGFFAFAFVDHAEGFGYFPFFEVLDSFGYFGGNLAKLEFEGAVVLVYHHAAVGAGVFVHGELGGSLFEGNLVLVDEVDDGVHEVGCFASAFGSDLRFEEDVAAVYAVALAVDELNDVVSELSLDNFGDLAFLLHVECDGGEFGDEAGLGVPAEVAATGGGAWVFGV